MCLENSSTDDSTKILTEYRNFTHWLHLLRDFYFVPEAGKYQVGYHCIIITAIYNVPASAPITSTLLPTFSISFSETLPVGLQVFTTKGTNLMIVIVFLAKNGCPNFVN